MFDVLLGFPFATSYWFIVTCVFEDVPKSRAVSSAETKEYEGSPKWQEKYSLHSSANLIFILMTSETRSRYPLSAHWVRPPLQCNSLVTPTR